MSTAAADGTRLDGVVARPAEPDARASLGVVCVPGLYAAFYDPPYVELARGLAAAGYLAVVGNDRGHDFGAVLRGLDGRPCCGGGGWERLEESALDAAAWIGDAVAEGCDGVVLAGHSLGARKAAYYQAVRQDPRVLGIVAISPFARRTEADVSEIGRLARRMVDEGRGRDLLPWPDTGCSMSAQTYLDHELPEAALNNVFVVSREGMAEPYASRIRCPLLAVYGSEEEAGGKPRVAELEAIRRNATSATRVDTLLIEGAGHTYAGHERALARAIADWAASLPGRRGGPTAAGG